MTDLRQAAQQSLKALEKSVPLPAEDDDDYAESGWRRHQQAITALRTALEQPCIGKDPRCPCQDGDVCHYKDCGGTKARPVPPTPPQQQAEPLPREGFEKWAKSLPNYIDLSRFETGYSDCNTDYAWAGWQAALAQPQQPAEQEPVATVTVMTQGVRRDYSFQALQKLPDGVNNLYTTPPQRQWVGLTDDDCTRMSAGDKLVAMWAEAKLKERNHDR